MDSSEFKKIRSRLKKTQAEMALLLGTSLKAVRSYEQGWRNIPVHAERQLYFLISRIMPDKERLRQCWDIKKCPTERKVKCPAWEFRAGDLCWFINGTICEGSVQKNWEEKMEICKTCKAWNLFIQKSLL